MRKISAALISVFNKDGIDEIATKLHNQNIKIISTGGTKSFIENLGIPVTSVESINLRSSSSEILLSNII